MKWPSSWLLSWFLQVGRGRYSMIIAARGLCSKLTTISAAHTHICCVPQTVLGSQTCGLWSSYRRASSAPYGRSSLAIAPMTPLSSPNSSCVCRTFAHSTICTLTSCWPSASTLEQEASTSRLQTHRQLPTVRRLQKSRNMELCNKRNVNWSTINHVFLSNR